MTRKIDFARQLRREQTSAEELLWSHLRGRRLGGFKFRRQSPIHRYIVDFVCVEAKLIIEVDGPTHDSRTAADAERTRLLGAMGYLVLRVSNTDVYENVDEVLDEIFHALELREANHSACCEPPHPNPLPMGRGNREPCAA